MSETQTETSRVRVEELQTTTAENPDYQFILEENMRLLREVESLSKTALNYDQKTTELQKQITQRDLKLAKSKAFSRIRKFVAVLHVLLAIGVGGFGPTLWLLRRAPAEAWWGIAGGFVWLLATTAWIDTLADNERNQ